MTSNANAKGKSTMTYSEAQDVAVNLEKEGMSLADITKTLTERGYRSGRLKAPIKEQMVKYMIRQKLGTLPPSQQRGASKGAGKSKTKTPTMEVSRGPKGDMLELIKVIVSQDGLSVDVKLDALRNIIAKAPRNEPAAPSAVQ